MKRSKQICAGVAPLVLLLALLGCGGGGGGGLTEPPSVTITATPSSIIRGQSSTLEWQSENAVLVMESNFGATEVSGTKTVSPASTTTYSITVGIVRFFQATQSVTVNVGETELPPTLSLTAIPSTINPGESATLSWTSSNADALVESNFGATTLSGSLQVSPTVTTTYYIIVSGPSGQARQSARVTVIVPGNTPPRAGFAVTPNSGYLGTLFQVDASACTDDQDQAWALEVAWDWEDDGTYDTEYSTTRTAAHQYATEGTKTIRLRVRDTGGLIDTTTQSVTVAVLPAGPRIAFSSNRDGDYEIGDYREFEIYVMNSDGSNQTRLTSKPGWDSEPFWSPDGSKIAFTSGLDPGTEQRALYEIYVMNSDGTNLVNLTNFPGTDEHPAWSLDGTKIAFTSWRTGDAEVFVMNSDGTSQWDVTNNPADDYSPSWSPDGSKIAFVSNRDGGGLVGEIYVMNSDGSNQTRLTYNSPTWDDGPSWSPDGSKIAFHSYPGDIGNLDIYVMNPDGSNQTRLTYNPAPDYDPTWSPDGTKIAFFSYPDWGTSDIYVMNSDGSNQTRLTNHPANDQSPSWSPF